MGVGLYGFFFKVSHKGMAQLGADQICNKVGIEEDSLHNTVGVEEDSLHNMMTLVIVESHFRQFQEFQIQQLSSVACFEQSPPCQHDDTIH